jgi:hypothetical protein
MKRVSGRTYTALVPASSRFLLSLQIACVCILLLALGFLPGRAGAQKSSDDKAPLVYRKPPAHAKTFRVTHIEGQVVFAPSSEKRVGAASGLRIALFNAEHASVANVFSGEEGRFEIPEVAPGFYTLIVAAEPLHPLSVPLQVMGVTTEGAPADPALLLSLRPKADRAQSVATRIADRLLRAELLSRTAEDQAIRNEAIQHGMEHPDPQIQARWNEIDARNLARMREIVARYGWPDRALVGLDGTEAAFLLLQHSPYDFQKMLLPRIYRAYRAGQLTGQDYALLSDRVQIREGKPQVYGTQVVGWHDKEPDFYPIENAPHVDRRRAKIGLPPLAAYVKILKEAYFPEEKARP